MSNNNDATSFQSQLSNYNRNINNFNAANLPPFPYIPQSYDQNNPAFNMVHQSPGLYPLNSNNSDLNANIMQLLSFPPMPHMPPLPNLPSLPTITNQTSSNNKNSLSNSNPPPLESFPLIDSHINLPPLPPINPDYDPLMGMLNLPNFNDLNAWRNTPFPTFSNYMDSMRSNPLLMMPPPVKKRNIAPSSANKNQTATKHSGSNPSDEFVVMLFNSAAQILFTANENAGQGQLMASTSALVMAASSLAVESNSASALIASQASEFSGLLATQPHNAMRILASNVRFNNSALMLGALGNSPGGSLLAHSLVNDCANDFSRARFQDNNKKRKADSDIDSIDSTNQNLLAYSSQFEGQQSRQNVFSSVLPPSMAAINLPNLPSNSTLQHPLIFPSQAIPPAPVISESSSNSTTVVIQTKAPTNPEALSIFSASDFPSDEALKTSLFGPIKKRPPPKRYIKKLKRVDVLIRTEATNPKKTDLLKPVDNVNTIANDITLPITQSLLPVESVKDSPIEPVV